MCLKCGGRGEESSSLLLWIAVTLVPTSKSEPLKNCLIPIPAPRNSSDIPEMACHKEAVFGKHRPSVIPGVWIVQGLNISAVHQLMLLLVLVGDSSPSAWGLGSQLSHGLVELLTPRLGQRFMPLGWDRCPMLKDITSAKDIRISQLSVAASTILLIYLYISLCSDTCSTTTSFLHSPLHCCHPPIFLDLLKTMVPMTKLSFLGTPR